MTKHQGPRTKPKQADVLPKFTQCEECFRTAVLSRSRRSYVCTICEHREFLGKESCEHR